MPAVSPEVQIALIEDELSRYPDSVREHYERCIANGTSPQMAIGFATRAAPMMGGSDRAFNEGQRRKMNAMEHTNQVKVLEIARRAGVKTAGKYYLSGLGKYTDQAAWVSTADDVLDVCKKRNLTAEGLIKHKGREMPPPTPKPMADDIVAGYAKEILQKEPDTAAKVKEGKIKPQELKERIIAKHGRRRVS